MKAIMKRVFVGVLASAALFAACRSDRYDDARRNNPQPRPRIEGNQTPSGDEAGTGGSSNIGNTEYGRDASSNSDLTNGKGNGVGAAGNAGVTEGRGPPSRK